MLAVLSGFTAIGAALARIYLQPKNLPDAQAHRQQARQGRDSRRRGRRHSVI
jgi:hypothetical protein